MTPTGYSRVWQDWVVTPSWRVTAANSAWRNWNSTATSNQYTYNIQAPRITVTTASALQSHVWGEWQSMGVNLHDQRIANEQSRERPDRIRGAEPARREERSRRQLAARQQAAGARERARELLDMILTPEQKLYREEHNGEVLVVAQSGKLYVVDTEYHGVHGNIWETDEHGCKLRTLCVAPDMHHHHDGIRMGMPLEDGFVGQILALRFNEAELLKKANYSGGSRKCRVPDVPILGRPQRNAA